MSEKINIIEEAKKYLISYVEGTKTSMETIHPLRNGWEFVVQHSLRVGNYVLRILEDEKHKLSNEEIELVRIAAILHDIGRIHKRENHAKISEDIVKNWLDNNLNILAKVDDVPRLLTLISSHSNNDENDDDFGSMVLKDADLLDEIGAMSIFMTSNHIDKNSSKSFHKLLDRVNHRETNFFQEHFNKLNTNAAKEILLKNKQFIDLVFQ